MFNYDNTEATIAVFTHYHGIELSKFAGEVFFMLMFTFHLNFQNGESALHAAALFGHLNIVKKLVESGADHHLQNKVKFLVESNHLKNGKIRVKIFAEISLSIIF